MLVFIPLINGCIPIPYNYSDPINEQDRKEIAELEHKNLREHLGSPKVSYILGGDSYQVYEYPPGSAVFPLTHPVGYVVFGALILFMTAIDDSPETELHEAPANDWNSSCLLVSIKHESIATAEVRPFDENRGCEEVFRDKLLMVADEAARNGDNYAAVLHAIWTDKIEIIRRQVGGVDLEKAIETAENTGNIELLVQLGKSVQVDPDEQMRLYDLVRKVDFSLSLFLLCETADSGHPEAQLEVGHWLRNSSAIRRNIKRAYVWYNLPTRHGHNWNEWELRQIKAEMTSQQLSEAEQMLADWQPGQCIEDLFTRHYR